MAEITKNLKVLIHDSRTFWKGKIGIVLSTISDSNDLNQYVKVKVQIGDNKNVIETFLLSDLELIDFKDQETLECLNEKLEIYENKIKDIIKPYLIVSDFDDKESESWFFANRIAIAENLDVSEIIKIAKSLKYPVFKIKTQLKEILIIGSRKITADMLENEYGRFLLGYIRTERI